MKDYRLIVIEQEKVPMASGPGMIDNLYLFWATLAVMLAAITFFCIWNYLTRCRVYRKRIRELDPGGRVYLGWNIRRLAHTVEELSLSLAGSF